ncbi:M48 family metallopeptidase [Alienimonas sp. DA493]|uniref:M48 metallopeptidase family protein n=1 Tax=Alienimonas sp. DA493 TaxID=3373605 RepID=UPI003754F3DF
MPSARQDRGGSDRRRTSGPSDRAVRRRRRHERVSPRTDACRHLGSPQSSPVVGDEPEVRLRAMRRRWGSCTRGGTILLHPALARAPRPCVEYVVAHEFCHLLEFGHGRPFYRLLTTVLPDWEERREMLSRYPGPRLGP